MDRIFLKPGAHPTLADGGCVMEFTAWVAGEKHSDRPRCVSPVIAAFLRRLNDRLDDEHRQALIPYAISVIGTNTGRADDVARAYLCADWACRTVAPWWMDRANLHEQAATLRALPGVVDNATAEAARKSCRAAAAYAYAAAAAYAYADADADAAAYAYAAAAAYAYADADAAADAYAAAAAALLPSALALVERMVAVGQRRETDVIEERRSAVACSVA